MKKIFVIDWILVFVFVLSAFSGIGLHIAGHGNSHEVWHNWAVFHVLTSFLFFVAAIFHITTHWGWYKGTIKNGLGKKRKNYGGAFGCVLTCICYRNYLIGSKRG